MGKGLTFFQTSLSHLRLGVLSGPRDRGWGGEWGGAGRASDQGLGLCQGLWPVRLLHQTKQEVRFF